MMSSTMNTQAPCPTSSHECTRQQQLSLQQPCSLAHLGTPAMPVGYSFASSAQPTTATSDAYQGMMAFNKDTYASSSYQPSAEQCQLSLQQPCSLPHHGTATMPLGAAAATTTAMPLAATTTTYTALPATTTTATTTTQPVGMMGKMKAMLPGHHATTGTTTTATTGTGMATSDKKLMKEQKKREKLMLKERKQREKEERKARKLQLKEEEKRIEAQRELHMAAQKARMEKYRAEEKATTARLMSDVKEFDLAHAQTAPLGLYSEQVDDALPYVPENVGLFIAVARGQNIIDLKEAKADAYLRVSLLGRGAEGKEVVHAMHKSEVISNSSNPQWWWHADDTPHLVTEHVGWLRSGKLRIEVWDHDKTSEDELLGSIEWPLSALDGKVTRGNFALNASQLPLATGRTARKATKPGTIFVEIRYRSPFAFLGMHNKQAQSQSQAQPMMMQQQQGMGALPAGGMMAAPIVASGAPLLATGAPLATGHHHTGLAHQHEHHHVLTSSHQPIIGQPLATASTTGVSTVYKAPDVIMPAGTIAPGAAVHTHHIHATELPASSVTTTMSAVPIVAVPVVPLLGGEQSGEYRKDLLHKSGMAPSSQQPMMTAAPLTGASTPMEPHNIMHNKTAGMPVSAQPISLHDHATAATLMPDAAPLPAKPVGLQAQQPILMQPVGVVNMADPPRHTF